MRQRLDNKVVMITGAARGIGAETARRAAAKGARVSLVGLEPERLRALADELGDRAAWFEADVTDQASMDGAVAGTVAAFGGIDVVLANAGVGNSGTVAISPADVLVRTIDINVNGVVRTVSAALPHITERRGYVMIVSSTAAFTMMPGMAAYAASKAAVEQFANCLRLEVAHKGVKVGSVHPGWIDTDLVRDQRKDLKTFDEAFEQVPVADERDHLRRGLRRRDRRRDGAPPPARLRAEGDRPRAGAAHAHHRRGRQLAHPPRGGDRWCRRWRPRSSSSAATTAARAWRCPLAPAAEEQPKQPV